MNFIYDTDLHRFQKDVLDAQFAVLVDFWADWCPPCRTLTPILERVVHDLAGEVRLAKIEVDEGENMKLAGRYKLRGFPTVILFRNGEELGRFSSAKPDHWIRHFLKETLATNTP